MVCGFHLLLFTEMERNSFFSVCCFGEDRKSGGHCLSTLALQILAMGVAVNSTKLRYVFFVVEQLIKKNNVTILDFQNFGGRLHKETDLVA